MPNFYLDVIRDDSRFLSTHRISDLKLLEPVTRDSVLGIIADAEKMGVPLLAFETYRSQSRQGLLFDQGASKLRNVGVHHYGLAADLVRVIGGDPSWKGDWKFLGDLARKHGMIWGGDWGQPNVQHKLVDSVHVQRCTVAQQEQLFSGGWYPDDNFNPWGDGTVVA